MASGHVNRVKRPNTWLHRPMLQNVKKVLANPEPSTHGAQRPSLSHVAETLHQRPQSYTAQRRMSRRFAASSICCDTRAI
jgi:hypothetical protein